MKDGVITNDNRIVAALPTIKKLVADGGKVILCSHLGKPEERPRGQVQPGPLSLFASPNCWASPSSLPMTTPWWAKTPRPLWPL